MYLVIIEKLFQQDKIVYAPKIEKIQSFSYQLRAPEWSCIDFIPEKGARFEIHFGPDFATGAENDEPGWGDIAALLLAASASDAINAATDLAEALTHGQYVADSHGMTVLYIEGQTKADHFARLNK